MVYQNALYHACSTMAFYKVWDVTRATKKMLPAASIKTVDDLTSLGMTFLFKIFCFIFTCY